MKHKVGLLILIIIFSFFNSLAQDENVELLRGFHSISSHEILDFAKELSSEKYKGRLSGSPEYLQAAEWCASKFKEWGVQPANNDSYFQYFPNEYSKVFSEGSVTYSAEPGAKINLNFPEDYYPGSNSASGTVSGELVYVGHGITAPELGYDDYENVDVEGKIVLMESGIPYSKNDSTLSDWTPYAYHRYKFRNAVKHGAAGLLYIGKIANPNTVNLDGFVYAHIIEEVADRIFADAGKDYKTVRKELSEQKFHRLHFLKNKRRS